MTVTHGPYQAGAGISIQIQHQPALGMQVSMTNRRPAALISEEAMPEQQLAKLLRTTDQTRRVE